MFNNIIIAMWSGPRNLSTALMRSFGNRSDVTNVLDEPFYASYLASTNKDHPMKKEVIESQPNNIDEVKKKDVFKKIIETFPDAELIDVKLKDNN